MMDGYRTHITQNVPEVAIQFFLTFARFEFALKRGGFLKGEIGRRAEPNWNLFANSLRPEFYLEVRSSEGAKVFFEAPPKVLKVVGEESVEFAPRTSVVNAQQLFEAVCLVRNNLFHGEKSHFTDRDHTLVRSALFVLDAAISHCDESPKCQRVPGTFQYAQINEQ